MKNLQRGIRVITLLALFVTGIVLFAQEATETPAEATAEATSEMTEVVATVEASAEATEVVETPEATLEATAEMTPEVTEVAATPAPESTEAVQVTPAITEIAGGTVSVVGSGIANPLFQSIASASGSANTYNVTTTGSQAGFAQFCAGTADVATSIRTINTEEDAACQTTGVEYMELLVAYDVMVIIANNQDSFLACLTADNLNNLFAPSASASLWDEVALQEDPALALTPTPIAEVTAEATGEVTPEVTAEPLPAISLYVPADNSLSYVTLDNIVAGFGLSERVVTAEPATIVANVRNNRGAIGVVPLEAALTPDSGVFILGMDFAGDVAGCVTPSIFTVEDGSYTAATPIYFYVNKAAQEKLAFYLDFLVNNASVQTISDAGFSAASTETYEINRAVILGEEAGRAFSAETATYIIPSALTGTINVVGSPLGFRIADGTASQLAQTQQGLTINRNLNSQVSGITEYCTGLADILIVRGNGENLCETPVDSFTYSLGYQTTVLLANANDTYAACLSLEQINSLWNATSTDTVSNWNALGESFPDQALTLLGIREGSYLSDILLTPAGGGSPAPVRVDVTETNNDPLYRGAAVAIVPGALTYMSWDEYQRVVTNGQSGIQLVAVNAGAGCVVPSEASIMDGTYSLARQVSMVVKSSSLATVPVQSYLWTIFTDTSYTYFNASGLGFLAREDFPQIRADLLVDFAQAEQAAAIAAEMTPEATVEVTAEATAEATEAGQ